MQGFKKRSSVLIGMMMFMIVSSLSLIPIFAQDNPTIITVAIEEYQQNFFNDEAFAPFEEANNVDVVTVVLPSEGRYFGAPEDTDGVEDFLDSVNALASEADLLPFDFLFMIG